MLTTLVLSFILTCKSGGVLWSETIRGVLVNFISLDKKEKAASQKATVASYLGDSRSFKTGFR